MTKYVLQGGPKAGLELDVPDGISSLNFAGPTKQHIKYAYLSPGQFVYEEPSPVDETMTAAA